MSYPLLFEAIIKERLWGGKLLETLYGKAIPFSGPAGESWEITDRLEGVSTIRNGPWKGQTLRWAMENHSEELLGNFPSQSGRFPWLMKILDARENLSLQVHPPAALASAMGGEPKTEMWFVAQAERGATLYAGLKTGTTRQDFIAKIHDGSVDDCFHQIPVRAGDALFVPSGRVHALGKGLVIFEIQQNSDTTYRVFDWNRVGLDGKPRALHVEPSLACINFDDFEPALISPMRLADRGFECRNLVSDPLFQISICDLEIGGVLTSTQASAIAKPAVVVVVEGNLTIESGGEKVSLIPGDFCLLPASLIGPHWQSSTGTRFLLVEATLART